MSTGPPFFVATIGKPCAAACPSPDTHTQKISPFQKLTIPHPHPINSCGLSAKPVKHQSIIRAVPVQLFPQTLHNQTLKLLKRAKNILLMSEESQTLIGKS